MNGNGVLQHYCDAMDRVFEDHQLKMRIIGGKVDEKSGVVSFRAPIDDLRGWRRVERDLARVLGVRQCRLFLVIEARASDNEGGSDEHE